MCAIAGIIDWKNIFCREELVGIGREMRDAMVHRGPDDAGIWVNDTGDCLLAHRRLSVIDLSPQGRQPMSNEDGSVWTTFNGELYNFRQLRDRLIQAGHLFQSQTDSEILPHLFEDMDYGHIDQLDGMFAFAVWNQKSKCLLLARDPFGKKPLYYSNGAGYFAFASELKALRAIPQFDATIDRDALSLYLLTQYVPAPYSIHLGAKKLLPGHFLEADFSGGDVPVLRIQQYADFLPTEPLEIPDPVIEIDQLQKLVINAVEKRLVADVPLGAFLSGGVDSSLVTAIASKEFGRKLKTFTIGFKGARDSEHIAAREIAEYLGVDHHEKILEPDDIGLLDEIASRLDEPNGDSSCWPTFLLSQYAREYVTVALSGDGGDEMFGGYNRYRDTLLEEQAWLQNPANGRSGWKPSSAYLSPRWLIFQPDQVESFVGAESLAVRQTVQGWEHILDAPVIPLLHRMRYLDAHTYLPGAVLPKVDRMSMQVSLEVRSPFLDASVAGFASQLSVRSCWRAPDDTKHILKSLASRYLPEEWMRRPKLGFGLPTNSWSKSSILKLANQYLLAHNARILGYMDKTALKQFLEQQENKYFSIYKIWPLLILEAWLQNNDFGK